MKVRRLIVLTAVIAASVLTPATALADDGPGSFPGCPLLSESRSSGPCVTRLQHALNTVNSDYGLEADGRFGPDTRIAVLDFQGRNHLGADGRVGSETATELAEQARRKGSVATPGPGRTLTPEERCDTLGPDWIVFKGDRCSRDGAIPQGLSGRECAAELAGAKAFEEALTSGADEETARLLASKAVSRALLAKDLWDVAKCVFWTTAPEQERLYRSVPMP